MTVRFIFECSQCGSEAIRLSSQWTWKDTMLKKVGITAQRCLRCRRRFYLYRPGFLRVLVRTLGDTASEAKAASGAKAAGKPLQTEVLPHREIELEQLSSGESA